jgi:23S rRNA (pseudouridine1915-N3)-methyltransferase
MKTVVLATGTCRNSHMLALEADYYTRIPKALQPKVIELTDGPTAAHTESAQRKAISSLPTPTTIIMLDETGQSYTSRQLADKLSSLSNHGIKTLAFLIGGADGLSSAIKQEADLVLSLGKLTLPHQLVRVLLAEQLYRAHTLHTGHPYHRD